MINEYEVTKDTIKTNYKLINELIDKHNCSLSVFRVRYGEGMYIALGYSYLINDIADQLTGGDVEWDDCWSWIIEHDNLPIVLRYDIEEGMRDIENIIFNNIQDSSLENYVAEISEIYRQWLGVRF